MITYRLMSEQDDRIKAAIKAINAKYGEGSIIELGGEQPQGIDAISTGSFTLDIATGIGGIPRGRITELFGSEGAGKTTLALHAIANAQRSGISVAFIDVEHALDLSYAARCGVDIKSLLVSYPDYGEAALDIMEGLIRAGVGLVVLDSVAALVPKSELAGDIGDSHFAKQPRLVGQALRMLVPITKKTNATILMINQVRDKMQGYGGYTTPGGHHLKHAASLRLSISRKLQGALEDNGIPIGHIVETKIVKTKVAPPRSQTAEFEIHYDHGIDWMASLITAAITRGVLTKSGSWYSYDGRQMGQGKDRVKEKLLAEPVLAKEIEAKILKSYDINS